jgi:hypothetical protein
MQFLYDLLFFHKELSMTPTQAPAEMPSPELQHQE